MKNYYICILMIIFLIFIIRCITYYKNKANSIAFIDVNKYPISKELFDMRQVFKDDLASVLHTNKWHIWSDDYKTTPIFTKMSESEIKEHLNKNIGKETNKTTAWRLFPIILNGKHFRDDDLCKNTYNILNKYNMGNKNKILNAGFSLLEPGCHIGLHKDYNKTFYRLHIPLVVPNNNKLFDTFITKEEAHDNQIAVLQVENDYRVWKENDYFILDDTYEHDAWNNSNEIRIVMLIDLINE